MLDWKTLYLMAGCAKSKSVIHRPAAQYDKVIELSSSGRSSITDHAKGKKQRCCGEAKKL